MKKTSLTFYSYVLGTPLHQAKSIKNVMMRLTGKNLKSFVTKHVNH